ncbi:MAG: 3-hydroxyacyl-CoA dehydrogenase NAD-binding domain-containing protein [Thermomicrobiales bacterium]
MGDLGWVDAEGYLFLADRWVDLIITGGANVYPAEVEAALTEHAGVGDVAVIGVPDEDWGKRVHAVIQGGTRRTCPRLRRWTRTAASGWRRTRSRSRRFVAQLPRDDAGKLRRSGLVAEREAGWTAGMIAAPRPSYDPPPLRGDPPRGGIEGVSAFSGLVWKEGGVEVRTIAMIGAGVMGHGIAQVLATAGYDVRLYDIRAEALTAALERIDRARYGLRGRSRAAS